jgi:hypothetical protein
MDTEQDPTPQPVASEGSTRNSEMPRRIILTCPVNLISFQKKKKKKKIKPLLRDQFSLRTSRAGVRVITHSKAD